MFPHKILTCISCLPAELLAHRYLVCYLLIKSVDRLITALLPTSHLKLLFPNLLEPQPTLCQCPRLRS